MPSDPLEAELLAMAGAAIGAGDNLLDDSDDSLPEDNYDAAPDHATANNHVPRYSEDIENMMSGKFLHSIQGCWNQGGNCPPPHFC